MVVYSEADGVLGGSSEGSATVPDNNWLIDVESLRGGQSDIVRRAKRGRRLPPCDFDRRGVNRFDGL